LNILRFLFKICPVYELIYLKLDVNNSIFNFNSAYKSPKVAQSLLVDHLEEYLLNVDLSIPLVVTGDLNMNIDTDSNGKLVSPNGQNLVWDYNSFPSYYH
jgi:hypothetical protein